MPDGKVLAKIERELPGQKVLWQGDCYFVSLALQTKALGHLVATPSGLHFFEKRMFGVQYQMIGAGQVKDILDAGLTVNTERGEFPALNFKFGQSAMVVVPLTRTPNAVAELGDAMRSFAA